MKTTRVKAIYFEFENDFVDTLRCIPMIVRFKLDACDKKLQLAEWSRLLPEEKKLLANLPCQTPQEIADYRACLQAMVRLRSQKEIKDLGGVHDSWNTLSEVPEEVQQKALEWNCPPPTLQQWIRLAQLQRFALVKLSRSGHEGENFPKALREFGIYTP
ncbi:nitrate reductase associated protein [Arundinibacter roseus]|uniref:Nitrate reductase associated protein n=1 Tax=Arundinibacter roseus TaxID=2070510 RepID=A0A4R4K258_9BACT|nr:nitrate reductase associated protein [Arundinibacter roseus]TDB61397.1 hypothetical protein EZE20_19525 [Arundinibacter roseus]